jgi:ATP-dependent Clp protease ATP-binding subunit ClpC
MAETKKMFNPEFINRIDELIVFHSLSNEDLEKIVELLLKECTKNVKNRDLTLEFGEEAKKFLVKVGYDPAYGARPLRRAVQQHIEDPLSEEVLRGTIPDGATIFVEPDENGEKLKFTVTDGSSKTVEEPEYQMKN